MQDLNKERQAVDVLKQWVVTPGVTLDDSTNLQALRWWRQFHSPELDAFMKKALQQNNHLNIALANIDFAKSELDQIKLNWLPSLSLGGGYSQFPLFGNPGTFLIAFPLYTLNLMQLYQQQRSAQARLQASVYAKDAARLLVISEVAYAYFMWIAQVQALNLSMQLLHDESLMLSLARSQYAHGLTALDEMEQTRSQMRQTQSQIDLIKHNIVVSKNALHHLMNENPGDLITHTSFRSLNSDALIPMNSPVRVLHHRPDVLQAEMMLKAANDNVGATLASLLPSISLGSYLGYAARAKNSVSLGQAYVSMPVIDFPMLADISASQAVSKASAIQFMDIIRQALRDVSNDLSAYLAYSKQLDHHRQAFRDEERRCRLVEARYRHGLSDQLAVIRCTMKLDKHAIIINQYKLSKMQAIVTLYQDLAGGYDGDE